MFITEAFAQSGGAAGGGNILISLAPFIAIFAIMYFLIIRPQRNQMKQRQEMLNNIRRNDTVITGGGIIAKVTKVIDENEVEAEISSGVKVKIARALISDVRVKGEPVKAEKTAEKPTKKVAKKTADTK